MSISLLLMATVAMISSNKEHPMKMIMSIVMLSAISSMEIFNTTKTSWTSIMIILTFVGGLMVVYSFMISMIPNEKEKNSKTKMKMIMIVIAVSLMMNKKMEKNDSINQIFAFSWTMLFTLIIMMIMCMMMMTEMIFSPNKNMKSTK